MKPQVDPTQFLPLFSSRHKRIVMEVSSHVAESSSWLTWRETKELRPQKALKPPKCVQLMRRLKPRRLFCRFFSAFRNVLQKAKQLTNLFFYCLKLLQNYLNVLNYSKKVPELQRIKFEKICSTYPGVILNSRGSSKRRWVGTVVLVF